MGSKQSSVNKPRVSRTVYGLDGGVNPFTDLKYVHVVNFGQYANHAGVTKFYVNVNVPEDDLAEFLSIVYGSGYFIGDPKN
jgi:hypothetical protein